jgi:hypothetical protein
MDAKINLQSDQMHYYQQSENDKHLLGFSSKISEAYRSAFLRVLQSFYLNKYISRDLYLEYAYATLPIDISKWKIMPNRAPEWWPSLKNLHADVDSEEKRLAPVSFMNSIEKLIETKQGKIVIAAEGAIQPLGSWKSSNPMHSFKLLAFGYEIIGSDLPTEKEVANALAKSTPGLIRKPSSTNKPFHFLEDKNNLVLISHNTVQVRDLIIYPLVIQEIQLAFSSWQYFRASHRAFNINIFGSENFIIQVNKNTWELYDKNKQSIVVYTDWLEGLKERYRGGMPLPYGQYLSIEENFLNEFLKQDNLRLGYLIKSTYRSEKNYYEIVAHEEVKLIGVSNIVLTPNNLFRSARKRYVYGL